MEKIYVTHHKGGKMDGMSSINFGLSEACKERQKIPGSVCSKCYAEKTCKQYAFKADSRYQKNRELLLSGIIPKFNNICVRINSIGEVSSVDEQLAYFRMCRENPDTLFVQWTKEENIVKAALKREDKPCNIRLIYSGLLLDRKVIKPYGFNHTLTVWKNVPMLERGHICEGKKCHECMYCYKKNEGQYTHIFEKLR